MTADERFDVFVEDLRLLCAKHELGIVVNHRFGVAEVLTATDPMPKLGEIFYIHGGRTGYTRNTALAPTERSR